MSDLKLGQALFRETLNVQRNIDTNAAAGSVVIKRDRTIFSDRLDEAVQVAGMSHCAAATITGLVCQHIGMLNGKVVGGLDCLGSLTDIGGQFACIATNFRRPAGSQQERTRKGKARPIAGKKK